MAHDPDGSGRLPRHDKKPLPDFDHGEFFVLNETNPAHRPPVFKRPRWAE